jgi:hypothetical protein
LPGESKDILDKPQEALGTESHISDSIGSAVKHCVLSGFLLGKHI